MNFLSGFEGLRALHLCANVNLPYLLRLGIELLSFDAFQLETMPKGYADDVAEYIKGGGVIAWGIVPTNSENLNRETPETLGDLLSGYWEVIAAGSDLTVKRIAEQALIAPARCCLKNSGRVGASNDTAACEVKGSPNSTVEEKLVEKAFDYLGELSRILKDRFELL